MKHRSNSLAAIAAAGLLSVSFALGQPGVVQAQDAPPPPKDGERSAPPPPVPPDGVPRPKVGPQDGPGPRNERPPHPPRPEDAPEPAQPVDPQAASVAVKTASDALGGLAPGQAWVRTAPRGEQQVQATILFQNREVARLEFDPTNGSLLARGQRPPPPPAPGAPAAPREARGPAARPDAPPPQPGDAPAPPAPPVPGANAPAAPAAPPVNLDQVKTRLAETIKALSVGQGAEIMAREGFWKVPLIYQNRVVGELRLSGDGTKIIQDFGAARDAAIFAR
jgi:hypothetical protein